MVQYIFHRLLSQTKCKTFYPLFLVERKHDIFDKFAIIVPKRETHRDTPANHLIISCDKTQPRSIDQSSLAVSKQLFEHDPTLIRKKIPDIIIVLVSYRQEYPIHFFLIRLGIIAFDKSYAGSLHIRC